MLCMLSLFHSFGITLSSMLMGVSINHGSN